MRSKSSIGKKNKRDGAGLERWIVNRLSIFFNLLSYNNKNSLTAEIGTTGVFSRALDNAKQDIWFKYSEFSDLAIQCKKSLTQGKTTKNIDISSLLVMDKSKIRILLTKLNSRPNKNEKEIGKFVTMSYEDFEKHFLTLWKEQNCKELKTIGRQKP